MRFARDLSPIDRWIDLGFSPWLTNGRLGAPSLPNRHLPIHLHIYVHESFPLAPFHFPRNFKGFRSKPWTTKLSKNLIGKFSVSPQTLVFMKRLILLTLLIPSLLWSQHKTNDLPKERKYADVGKLHMDEAKLIYGQPTSVDRGPFDKTILRWARTADRNAMDDWIANPYRRIPPGGTIDLTCCFVMALEFDKNGILSARRYEGRLPGMSNPEPMFRKP